MQYPNIELPKYGENVVLVCQILLWKNYMRVWRLREIITQICCWQLAEALSVIIPKQYRHLFIVTRSLGKILSEI